MLLSIFSLFAVLINGACNNKQPFKPDYENSGGVVIGKEICNSDPKQDYWLIDFTIYPNSSQIGDTLALNGMTYTNVLKVKGLGERLRQIGMRVSIDYKTITPVKVVSSVCSVTNQLRMP